jgi:hypothetical protein
MLKTATIILLIGVLFGTLYSVAVVVSPQTIARSTLKARVGIGLEAVQDRGAAEAFVGQTSPLRPVQGDQQRRRPFRQHSDHLPAQHQIIQTPIVQQAIDSGQSAVDLRADSL